MACLFGREGVRSVAKKATKTLIQMITLTGTGPVMNLFEKHGEKTDNRNLK